MYQNQEWQQPVSLRGNPMNLLPFPVHALPPVLKEMTEGISTSTCTDAAMAATALLSSISYCFSGQYRIAGKKDHTEPIVVDSLIVANASAMKSPVMRPIALPYNEFTKEYNEMNKAEFAENQAKRKLLISKISVMEKDLNANQKELADLNLELGSIRNADSRRIIVDDATPESLVRLLEKNGTLLMMSDEAGSLGNFNGRYSSNGIPNLDLLLKAYTGDTYISDRIGRDSITLYKPYISICLACQPYIWENMIKNQAFRGSGFLARLLYCFPRSSICRYDNEPVSEQIMLYYRKLIFYLLKRKFTNFEQGIKQEKVICLSTEAEKEMINFYNNFLQNQLSGEMIFCDDWCGKMHGHLLRICGIIHCIKALLNKKNPEDIKVTADTFCNALEIIHYFREQTIYAYGLSEADTQTIKAEYILKKIKAKYIHQIRQNELYKICRCRLFKNAAEFNEAINLLREYNYLKSETVPTENSNRSGTMLYFNPQI